MTNAQDALFGERLKHVHHLEYTFTAGTPTNKIKESLRTILSENSSEVPLLFAFGKKIWSQLAPTICPEDLQDFQTLTGKNGHQMPSTQCDLFIWLQAKEPSPIADALMLIQSQLRDIATLDLEVPGFIYRDSRDLTGFVDGTGNPKEDQRVAAALIPEGKEGCGGSYVLPQKWVHKMQAFQKLSTHEQEQTIGRTKETDIELEGDAMPPNSHVSRTDVKVGDKAMKIWRRSTPFMSAKEQGLYFLGFTCEVERFDVQLKRMLGLTEDNISDHLIEFSSAVSGSYLFAPSKVDLSSALDLPSEC